MAACGADDDKVGGGSLWAVVLRLCIDFLFLVMDRSMMGFCVSLRESNAGDGFGWVVLGV